MSAGGACPPFVWRGCAAGAQEQNDKSKIKPAPTIRHAVAAMPAVVVQAGASAFGAAIQDPTSNI